MHRELDGHAACIANPVTHPLGKLQVNAVTGIQVAAALGDTDDRAAVLKLGGRHPVVHEPLEVERGHIGA